MDRSNPFNEESLGKDIVAKWGEFGAHYDVFSDMRERLNRLETVAVSAERNIRYVLGAVENQGARELLKRVADVLAVELEKL